MKDNIIEEIKRRARLDHDGDFTKAAGEYFRNHPDFWQDYKNGDAGVAKREHREGVNAEIHYRLEWVAYRDKLDLDKPADRVTAQEKVFAEDPALYKLYAAANTVRVG